MVTVLQAICLNPHDSVQQAGLAGEGCVYAAVTFMLNGSAGNPFWL